jgi:hypothetical protein
MTEQPREEGSEKSDKPLPAASVKDEKSKGKSKNKNSQADRKSKMQLREAMITQKIQQIFHDRETEMIAEIWDTI